MNCADDYGHGNDMLLTSLGEFTGHVTDEEIVAFARSLGEEYGNKDRAEAMERLTYWRDRYARSS